MAFVGFHNPLHVFPGEVWDLVAENTHPMTFEVFRHAIPEVYPFIKPSSIAKNLFASVFKIVYQRTHLGLDDVTTCRRVCSSWKYGVDAYFQETNFYCIENQNGAKNVSDFILKMPLNLIDINRIYKMELHPGCVSFGKKLTLEMRYDHRGMEIFPTHLHQVNSLLQTVKTFWRQFEHLELRQWEGFVLDPDNFTRHRTRYMNPMYVAVPLGDVGTDQRLVQFRANNYLLPDNDFEMFIPFIHLMTNLRKLTLLSRHNILQHIPRPTLLEEVTTRFRPGVCDALSDQIQSVTYLKCAKNVCFLDGVTVPSLRTCAEWLETDDNSGPVFEKLKELHVLLDNRWKQDDLESLSVQTIKKMFPVVTVLGLVVEWGNDEGDLWECLGTFANKFPSLQYVSLSGSCKPGSCEHLEMIYAYQRFRNPETPDTTTDLCTCSGAITFRFQCPSHVPVDLMRLFPKLKHVIVEEWPGRCQRQNSKANDWNYVNGFLKMFPNISSLSFVPIITADEPETILRGTGKITRFRDVMSLQNKKH